jgi:hypothetical protein
MRRDLELAPPELERPRERLLNAYQAAVAKYAELQRMPSWHYRRRRALAQELNLACELADEARDELAARGGGYLAPARPLREVLDELGREVYGRTVNIGGR